MDKKLHFFLVLIVCLMTASALERAQAVTALFLWGNQTYVPPDLTNVIGIAAGDDHFLALRADRTVVAWGDNGAGQASVPLGLTNVVSIGAGEYHSLAVRADGTVAAWGLGQVNTGVWPYYGQSIVPTGLSNVVAVAGSDTHSLALRSDGTVFAWGRNDSGETNVPPSLTNAIAVA